MANGLEFPEPSCKVLTVEDAAADVLGVPRPGDDPAWAASVPVWVITGLIKELNLPGYDARKEKAITSAVNILEQLADAPAPTPVTQPAEMHEALLLCIAALERVNHCAEEDRLKAAGAARAALAAAPAPVGRPLTAAQMGKCVLESGLSWGALSRLPDNLHKLTRAVERACAKSWGVKLVEATGQEGGPL